tara:strand:- start:3204 stop:3401 length:198 start_codon:yes stop_codon:yes gene_type:complete
MSKVYIVLLLNKALLFSETKPKKKGNYIQGVRLFKLQSNVTVDEINQWCLSDYVHKKIEEVTNWE